MYTPWLLGLRQTSTYCDYCDYIYRTCSSGSPVRLGFAFPLTIRCGGTRRACLDIWPGGLWNLCGLFRQLMNIYGLCCPLLPRTCSVIRVDAAIRDEVALLSETTERFGLNMHSIDIVFPQETS